MRSVRTTSLAALAALVLLIGLSGRLRAEDKVDAPDNPSPHGATDAIDDQAHLFTRAGRAEAARRIAKIKEDTGLDLYVMTVEKMPESVSQKFPFWKRLQRDTFFTEWALSEAETAQIDGLFVLICKSPNVMKIVAYPPERDDYLPYSDRDKLRRVYSDKTRVQGGEPNGALLAVIDRYQQMLEAKGPPGKAVRPAWTVLLVLIAALLGLWLVLWLISRSAPNRGVFQGAVPLPDQSPVLLGGSFGTLPTFWIYDRLLRRPTLPGETPAGPVPDSGTA